MGTKPHSLKCCGSLLEQNGIISSASIYRSNKFAAALGKALLPVLTFDPYAIHRTTAEMWAVSWSPDGTRIASAGDDVHIWQAL